MDFIQAVFFCRSQHHGPFVEPPGCLEFSMLDRQPTHSNMIRQQLFQWRGLRPQQLGA